MLNIFSYAYLVNLYNVRIDLDSENSEKYLNILESLNSQEIIDMFSCFSPEIKIFLKMLQDIYRILIFLNIVVGKTYLLKGKNLYYLK